VTVLSFSFCIMIVANGGQALRLSSCYGVECPCPQVPREETGDALRVSPQIPPVSSLPHCWYLKPELSPIYLHQDLQCFRYRSKRSISAFTSVYLHLVAT
jgi:hypothetical protein